MLRCIKTKGRTFVNQPTNVMADSSKQNVGLSSKQKVSPARETMDSKFISYILLTECYGIINIMS